MVEVDKEYDTSISSLQESNEELLTKISSLTDTVGGLKTTVQGNKQDYLLDSKTYFGSLQQHGSQVLSLNGQFQTLSSVSEGQWSRYSNNGAQLFPSTSI